MTRMRLPIPDDFADVQCASCGGAVRREEAFEEKADFYHPDCAGVERCSWCGKFAEKGELVRADDGDLYHPACIREICERAGKGAES